MSAKTEVLEMLRMTCTSIRRGRRAELWEEAAKQEKRLIDEIDEAKKEEEQQPETANHG